jgi:hypothetical protein
LTPKDIRNLISKREFGICQINYNRAIFLIRSGIYDKNQLQQIVSALISDECSSTAINIYRVSLIWYLSELVLKTKAHDVVEEKTRILSAKGGAIFGGTPSTISAIQLPVEMTMPFSLVYGTSNEIFAETDYRGDLAKADAKLVSFFQKVLPEKITPETHSWIYSIGRTCREIYDNILNHAYFSVRAPTKWYESEEREKVRARFWFFSFRRYAFASGSSFFLRLPLFSKFHDTIQNDIRYFVAIAISDDGPGVVQYYNLSKSNEDAVINISQIVENNLSSTGLSGAGFGLENAISGIERNNGYMSIESGGHQYVTWYDKKSGKMESVNQIAESEISGTCVNILIPIFKRQ